MMDSERVAEATILQLQQWMNEGKLSSEQLVRIYIERIDRLDRQGPRLNSVLEVNPDAIEIARSLDQERIIKGPRGSLHGIPILVKDSIGTADRMHTSAGSLALAHHVAKEDAVVIRRLRDAGALILGKTNMTEWANYMSWDMPAGYSARGGYVHNPYGPGHVFVGGSSTGSAVAAAAGLCAGALGTETSASIISPAVQNSIVGMKTTVGLIDGSGVIPLAHSQDSIGPMTRTVTDAAALLSVIAGTNQPAKTLLDVTNEGRLEWIPCAGRTVDYTAHLDLDGLSGARIGIPRQYYKRLSPSKQVMMSGAIQTLQNKGAVVVDPVNIPSYGWKWSKEILRHEFKYDMNHYLSKIAAEVPVRSLKDLIAYNNEHPSESLRYGQSLLIWAEETSGTLEETTYIGAIEQNRVMSRERGIDYTMREYELDALLFPGAKGCEIAARAGYPSITVPGGYPHGYPYGVTFCSLAFTEPLLIRLAYAYEQATKHRLAPNLDSFRR